MSCVISVKFVYSDCCVSVRRHKEWSREAAECAECLLTSAGPVSGISSALYTLSPQHRPGIRIESIVSLLHNFFL